MVYYFYYPPKKHFENPSSLYLINHKMHIKQIIIRGFKTYREQVIIGPLSAKDNVFVGQNGHGKSNFFSAIMFVLSDKFSNIRQEEKQRLIHEGAGEASNSACVEIILDNSDSRLPIDKSTVSIKRILEDKKDEFYIDNKHVTKADINNLLESAGFSKSNPYYVVQQGRVASLAGMNESQCLDLLKEVAGTIVYDERKAESEKLIDETKRKTEKIQELMDRIQEKIRELQGESAELQDYTKLEKERRAMEYILYKNHVVSAQEMIDSIEATQADLLEKVNNLKLTHNNFQEEIDTYEAFIDSKNILVGKFAGALENLGQEMGKLQSEKVKVESKLSVYKEQRKKIAEDLALNQNEHKKVLQDLQKTEILLQAQRPEYQKIAFEEAKAFDLLKIKKRRKNELFTKQGSVSKFKNLKDRNKFLNSELKKLEDFRSDLKGQMDKVMGKINTARRELNEITSKLPTVTNKCYEEKKYNESLSEEIMNIKQLRAANVTQLATLRHKEEGLVSQKEQTDSKINQNTQKLRILLSGTLFSTLEKLKNECKNIPGFYGLLIDLITIPPKFQTCADIVAKTKVFSIVVDTFTTAKKVLDINTRIGGDRITIYPIEWIDEIDSKDRNYPAGSDSIALIKQIKLREGVNSEIMRFVNFIFGKTLLVRNQEVANRYAKDFKLHCVTPDGLMVHAGAYRMRAGFHDLKRERIRTYNEFSTFRSEINTVQQSLTDTIKEKDYFLNQDSEFVRKMQEISNEKDKSNGKIQEFKGLEANMKTSKIEIVKSITEMERAMEQYSKEISAVEDTIAATKVELSKTEIGELSNSEAHELEMLIKEVQELENQYKVSSTLKNNAESEMQHLEQQLNHYLPERERRLEELISDCSVSLESRDESDIQEDCKQITKQIESCEINIHRTSQDLVDINGQIREYEDKIKSLKENQQRLNQEVSELQTEIERTTLKLMNSMESKENYIKKMGALGSLPAEEHEKFKGENPQTLMRLLEDNSSNIKKYQHVNKRALEQYNKYTEKLEGLNEKISDLSKSDKSIKDLLLHLENVKDEAIIRTFRSVAQHFSEVFHEIVPQGKGRLKMVKGDGTGVEKYVGVSISVSFSRSEDAVYKMQQLSGGQKTAVAIALIVAIQRADPAPFYLFDELDAALDSQLRNSLAAVITRSAEKAQFIMTTFKPELCKNSAKIFEVRFKNKASTIRQIDKTRALEVIQQIDPSN